jgi:hypothetical protein
MKVYVHHEEQTIPIVIQPGMTVEYIAQLAGALVSRVNCRLSRTSGGRQISGGITASNFLSDSDDLWLTGDAIEETKTPAPANVTSMHKIVEQARNFKSLTKYTFYESGRNLVKV